jgi:hypothetical protein
LGEYLKLLKDIQRKPRHVQSDFARYNARMVAEASTRGHIGFQGLWYITKAGMDFMVANGVIV